MNMMSYPMRVTVALAILCIHQGVSASAYIDTDIFGYSESVPVVNAIDKWDGPFASGTDIFSHDIIEIGARSNAWSLGIFKRYDYELTFSNDTAEFYYRTNNKLSLDPGRKYDLDIVIRQSYSDGIRLGYNKTFSSKLKYNIGLSYLRGLDLTEGFIKGSATSRSEKDYDFQFDVSYLYSKDTLFDRRVIKPDGDGLSFDLSVDWQFYDKWFAELTIKDIFSFIHWYDTPYTTAVSSSDRKTFDENGYVVYQPVISGREDNRDYTQKLPTRGDVMFACQLWENISLLAGLNVNNNFNYYQFGGKYRPGTKHYVTLLYATGINALSIEYESRIFKFGFISDSFNINDARALGLNMSINKDW